MLWTAHAAALQAADGAEPAAGRCGALPAGVCESLRPAQQQANKSALIVLAGLHIVYVSGKWQPVPSFVPGIVSPCCVQQTALPAGGNAGLQPWTRDDLDSLWKAVPLTADLFYTAASELQQQVRHLPAPSSSTCC